MSSYASRGQQTDGLFRTVTVIGGNDINKERLFKHGDLQVHGGGVIKKSLFVGCEVIAGCQFTGNLVGNVIGTVFGDVVGNVTGNIVLPPSGVVSGTYGSSSRVPIFTVMSDGRLSYADETQLSLTTGVSGILPAAQGGTGLSSYSTGDILYASSPTTLAGLPDIATGNVLKSGGVGVPPVYGKVDLSTDVTGYLSLVNGGYVPPTNVLVVRKNPGPLEYLTINDAISAAVGSSSSNRYTIYIHNGQYVEPQLVVPDYVFIVGQSMQDVRIAPSALGFSQFVFSGKSGLAFVTLENTDPAYPAIHVLNYSNDESVFHKVNFENCTKGILCEINGSATQDGICRFEHVDFLFATDYAFRILDSNILGGFGQNVTIENIQTTEHSNDAVIVDGLNTSVTVNTAVMVSDGTGNAFSLYNGATLSCSFTTIMDWFKGFYVPVSSGTPELYIIGAVFMPSVAPGSLNIDILNLNTEGHFTGWTEYLLTQIPKTCPFFITTDIRQNIITVATKGGQFTSIVDALAAITDESATNLYTIEVFPGIYVETQIVLRPYIIIQGHNQQATFIRADNSLVGGIFINVIGGASAIKSVTLQSNYASPPLYMVQYEGDALGRIFALFSLTFDTSDRCVRIASANGPCVALIDGIGIFPRTPFSQGFDIECLGPSFNKITFLINNFRWTAASTAMINFEYFMRVISTQSPAPPAYSIVGRITNSVIGQSELTPPVPVFPSSIGWTGIIVEGSCNMLISSLQISGLSVGVYIPNNVERSYVNIIAITCILGVMDIVIESPIALGSVNGSLRREGVSIVDDSMFALLIMDPEMGVVQTGNLFQGKTWFQNTNISESIQHTSALGYINEHPQITHTGNLNVNVDGGTGYLVKQTGGHHLKYVEWEANSAVTLTSNALSWIYINNEGNVVTALGSEPNDKENIILGTVKTYEGNVSYIQEIGYPANHLATEITDILRDVFGPIVSYGCIGTPGSSLVKRAVAVSSGLYSFGVIRYTPVSADNINMIGYFGGIVEQHTLDEVPLLWDNTGILTAITPGNYIKHALYILSDIEGTTVKYFLVYGQEQFASLLAAQNGALPTPPPTFIGNMCPVSGIIVTNTDPSSPLATDRFQDIRPTLAFKAGSFTATSDHNSLTNLTVGDPHTQYLPVNGTRPMTGLLNMNTNSITNAGTINGVTITAHASRHLPGGPDALTTAAPVSIGTTNQIGVAASFSRSDHIHQGVHSITGTSNQISSSNLFGSVILSVPSTFVAPGTIKDTTGMHYSTSTGIIAAGATQGTATPLTTSYNVVSTVGLSTGVILPVPSQSGLIIVIVNRGVNSLNVYPNVGGQINALGINIASILPSGFTATYQASTTLQYYTISNSSALISGVTSGTYGSSTSVGQFTVNAQGQITNASNIAISAITVNAGTGLSGGGSVSPSGSITLNNAGVLSFSAGTTGLLPNTLTQGNVTLSGTLVAANGGTGQNSYTVGDLLYASASTTLSKLNVGLSNQILGVSGGLPSWTSLGSIGVSSVTGTTNQVTVSPTIGNVVVSIPSQFVAPGTIQDTTGMLYSTSPSVTAAGATQGTATVLTKSYNVVTTVALGTGVKLPTITSTNIGYVIDIINRGANTLLVYPDTGSTIDVAGVNNPISLLPEAAITLNAATTTQWYTINSPIVAGTGISVNYTDGGTTVSASNTVPLTYPISTVQITVTGTVVTTPYYTVWDNTRLGGYTNRKVTMWVIPGTGTRSLTVAIVNNAGPTLGSITIPGGSAVGLYSFTFTAPGANTRLDLTVVRSAGSPNDPIIQGINFELS